MSAENKDTIYAIRLMRGCIVSPIYGQKPITEKGPFEYNGVGVSIIIGMINGDDKCCCNIKKNNFCVQSFYGGNIDTMETILFRNESVDFCLLITKLVSEIIKRKYTGLRCTPKHIISVGKCDTPSQHGTQRDCHIALLLYAPYIRWMREIYNRLIEDIQNVYFCIDRGYNFEESELKVTISKQAEEIRALKKNIVELMRENEKNRTKSEKYDAMIGVFADVGRIFTGRSPQ